MVIINESLMQSFASNVVNMCGQNWTMQIANGIIPGNQFSCSTCPDGKR
jgi:hypothetical protein